MPSKPEEFWTGLSVTNSPLSCGEKFFRGLSAGRVQSVAVRLIADREKEIQAFKPEEYWSLSAFLNTKKEQEKVLKPISIKR